MTEAEQLAERISRALPRVKSGTLRFWGQWFGRPHDNWHRLVGCDADGDRLRLHFNGGETLSVWSPREATVGEEIFQIRDAHRVRWEWFSYGRPKTASNLYFEDFSRAGGEIAVTTNVDWYTPDVRPDPSEPAIEIL
jgi:hypothetical protein